MVAQCGDLTVVAALCESLKDGDSEVVCETLRALPNISPGGISETASSAVSACLEHPDAFVQKTTLEVLPDMLSTCSDEVAWSRLHVLACSWRQEHEVREMAFQVLLKMASLGSNRALTVLKDCSDSRFRLVQVEAKNALMKLEEGGITETNGPSKSETLRWKNDLKKGGSFTRRQKHIDRIWYCEEEE
eukprot:gnl/MRDRNA2_/MRDRNA2_232852_c0_seq1.p1 gnl/MRDRNA2_/MRDRNA2_232852_c0~~gnl/MRDRNA2_/MRDRNA2_232852_c0_seq1.p1  ORF type:complete len:220 (+),score=39.71 gnl/MRDRNA2_/MRDRNA2_232852_c0_seq1:95-661(+)